MFNNTNKFEKFVFNTLPKNVDELMSLPEYSLDTPFKTTSLVLVALLEFENNQDMCFQMIDALRGPEPMQPSTKAFIKERLIGKEYKVKSFFEGSTVENNYTPTIPYTIYVYENPYSYMEENWATMFIKSSGADSDRQIKLRKKPSTGQWFVTDIQCLSDIREPKNLDPWA